MDLHYTVEPAGTVLGDIPLYSSKGLLRYVNTPLLQGEHVLIPRKGNLSNVMLVNGSFRTNDTVFYGSPRIPNAAKYIYYFLRTYGVEKLDIGAQKPQINKGRLKRVMVPMPDGALLEKFEKREEEYEKKIASLEAEIIRLEHTRDEMIEELIGKFSGTVSGTN